MLFAMTLHTVLPPSFCCGDKDTRGTRSELDLVKEGVTVDVLDNKSLMEPRLVIQRKINEILSILF